jgi:exosortase family protein XrtF
MQFIKQHQPFFVFLGKFLLFYLVFTQIYNWYLGNFDKNANQVDGITTVVTQNTKAVIQWFEPDCYTLKHDKEASVKIIYKNKYVSRIVEGCNAISVIILFAAFVFAFSGKWLRTFLFIVLGSFIIYFLNVFRIASLTIALYHYPAYEGVLHDIVFPLVIYSVVFIQWLIWVFYGRK